MVSEMIFCVLKNINSEALARGRGVGTHRKSGNKVAKVSYTVEFVVISEQLINISGLESCSFRTRETDLINVLRPMAVPNSRLSKGDDFEIHRRLQVNR